MKMRFLLTLAVLAIGFTLPIFAQEANLPDPQLRDALATLTKKIDDAYIKGDAAALAALYTEDATLLRSDGAPIYGRDAIEQYWRARFQQGQFPLSVNRSAICAGKRVFGGPVTNPRSRPAS